MKCQILFSQKNKKNITNFWSAEYAQSVVKVYKFSGALSGVMACKIDLSEVHIYFSWKSSNISNTKDIKCSLI